MSIVFCPTTKGHMCIYPLSTNVTSSLSRRYVARRIYPTEVNLYRLLMYTRIFESITNYQSAMRCFYYVAKRIKQEHDGPSHTQLYLIQMYTYFIQHKPSRTITPSLQQSSHMPTTTALRVGPRSSLQIPQTFPQTRSNVQQAMLGDVISLYRKLSNERPLLARKRRNMAQSSKFL
jgi:hypothetical protein